MDPKLLRRAFWNILSLHSQWSDDPSITTWRGFEYYLTDIALFFDAIQQGNPIDDDVTMLSATAVYFFNTPRVAPKNVQVNTRLLEDLFTVTIAYIDYWFQHPEIVDSERFRSCAGELAAAYMIITDNDVKEAVIHLKKAAAWLYPPPASNA